MTSVFTFGGYGGKFSVQRNYIAGVCASWVPGSVDTLSSNVWRVQGVFGGVTTYQEYVFYPNFLDCVASRYTPDRFILDHYYVNLPSTTHLNPLPIIIGITYHPITSKLYLDIDSLGFPDMYFLDLPPCPIEWLS